MISNMEPEEQLVQITLLMVVEASALPPLVQPILEFMDSLKETEGVLQLAIDADQVKLVDSPIDGGIYNGEN